MPLRRLLRRLIWISILPLLAAAIYLTVDNILALKARTDREAGRVARNLAAAIDGRLAAQIAALQVLATSPLADDTARLEDLYRQAQGLRRSLDSHVIFADLSMQMLLNTRVPFGTPLPRLPKSRGRTAAPIAVETGKPVVGDIVAGPVANEPLVAVAVPVLRDGESRSVFLSTTTTRRFQEILDSFQLSAEWIITLMDGAGQIMAARSPTGMSASADTPSREGRFVAPLEMAPWSVVVDVPTAAYRRTMVDAALTLAAGIAVATLIGYLGAAAVGRRLAGAVATLAEPSGPPSPIVEIEAARQALAAAAAEHEAAEEAERESRQHLRASFEQAAVGIAHVASGGRFLRVNPRFCEITGHEAEDLLHRTFQDITHPDDLDRDLALVRQLHSGERNTFTVEKRYVRADGNVVWTTLTVSVIRDSDGRPEYFVAIIEDITERHALEEQLRQAQKMEAVGQLTGGLAHDLNNVLSVISMNVELLDIDAKADPKAAANVQAALKGVRRASEMTRKLLDFSRTEVGDTQRVSLNEFVAAMQSLIAKSLTPAITLEVHQEADVWPVDVDPGDFEAALLNLALNARDAMPKGGTLVIETANKVIDEAYVRRNPSASAGEFVMVAVSDTGTGMAPDVVAKAFDPFFTTKEVGKGTGLGLSMVYGFVKRSGGHAKIYSEPGAGTTVRLYLPRAAGTAGGTDAAPKGTSVPRGTETILVVDDEAVLLDAAVTALNALGYRTISAQNGPEALDILRREPAIDLLFSDVVMPKGMDGYRLAIAALDDRPNLRVLLTSGFTRKREEFVNEERAVAEALSQTLLAKPYNVAELAVAVRRVLDGDG